MHDFSCKNVTEDPIKIHITLEGRHERESAALQCHENFATLKIPGQLNEVTPLTPVQIFVKEEQFVHDQLDEVVPLSPVQIFVKQEDAVYCNTEEPELVPLVPVLPKEELVETSSEEWSNQGDPLAFEQSVANESYVEYVETSEPILMELGATSTEGSSHSLRITQESTSSVENGEVYNVMDNREAVTVSENGEACPDGGQSIKVMEASRVPAEVSHCGFRIAGEVQTHAVACAVWRDVTPRVRTLRAHHACGDCGQAFERLDLLMRHRLSHIRAALTKPSAALKLLAMPKTQVSTTPDSRRTAVPVSARTSPKRSPQRAATTPQPKRWVRRKKARRRRVS